jgi:hypothetical protein
MNLSLRALPLAGRATVPSAPATATATRWADVEGETTESMWPSALSPRRLGALLTLLSLYSVALLIVMLVSDGPDIGCILMGIFGHVSWVSGRSLWRWRQAVQFDRAVEPIILRRRRRERRTASIAAAA